MNSFEPAGEGEAQDGGNLEPERLNKYQVRKGVESQGARRLNEQSPLAEDNEEEKECDSRCFHPNYNSIPQEQK